MTARTLQFKTCGCEMTLNMPTAMMEMPIGNIRKFFKIIGQEYQENEESIRLYFDYIPEIEADLKEQWSIASRDFQNRYKDIRFNENGGYIADKKERDKRRNHNARLMSKVKSAKSRYDRFLKKIPKLEVIKEEIYGKWVF